uniref:DUF7890 domain-containing protein n=1 Tax=Salix viminalis TaxID=40686 RepID=A0A6N2MKX1_SALVM
MFASYFSSIIVDATDRIRRSKGAGLIYRDELSKKMPSKKGYDCLASNNEKRGFASSACREGGVLEFKDVAHELAQIPVNRVSVISSAGGYGGVLHSIPEE